MFVAQLNVAPNSEEFCTRRESNSVNNVIEKNQLTLVELSLVGRHFQIPTFLCVTRPCVVRTATSKHVAKFPTVRYKQLPVPNSEHSTKQASNSTTSKSNDTQTNDDATFATKTEKVRRFLPFFKSHYAVAAAKLAAFSFTSAKPPTM